MWQAPGKDLALWLRTAHAVQGALAPRNLMATPLASHTNKPQCHYSGTSLGCALRPCTSDTRAESQAPPVDAEIQGDQIQIDLIVIDQSSFSLLRQRKHASLWSCALCHAGMTQMQGLLQSESNVELPHAASSPLTAQPAAIKADCMSLRPNVGI